LAGASKKRRWFVFGSRPSEASGLFSWACLFLTEACCSAVLFFERLVLFGCGLLFWPEPQKSVLGGVFSSLPSEASGLFSWACFF